MTTPATIDVLDPALWDDPHGALARARAAGPVARTSDGQPVLLRYGDVDEALRHPGLATFSVQSLLDQNGIADGPLREWCDLLMLSLEGDDHTRLRGLVSRAFTPRRVDEARAGARAFVHDLLASGGVGGWLVWVHDVAHELPVWVVCEMLGVPSDDRHLFKEWTVDLALTFANVLTPAERARTEHALSSLYDYVRALVAERRDRRGRPTDDLLGALVDVEHEGQRLSPAEPEAMVVNLLQGGHETTRSALSIALASLLAHPDQLDRLHADPSLVPGAVEELLRFESPTFSTMRIARQPVTIGPITLQEDEPVHLSLMAANRDPDRFDRADVLDVGRSDVRHVSFDYGVHHCIGAALARLELQEALAELVTSCREISLEIAAPVWVPYLQVRRIEALPLSFRRVAAA
jgi:cytochrome P450